MKINQKLIPASNKFTRPGIKMTPKYITIHETANTGKGANALAHANLQYRGNDRKASWHYTVDDKEIWQSLPDNEVGYHAGDGSGPGNRQSIGIEICVNSDGDYTKAKKNAAWLVAQLMKKHKIPLGNVVQHSRWSGKNCPAKLRASGWSAFLKDVEAEAKGTTTPAKWDGKSFPGRDAFKIGKSHPAVTVLGQRLVAHGYSKHYKVGPGPTFSEADRKNVQDFQKAQGWTGSDADGYPGPETWKRLMATAKGEKKPAPKPDPVPSPGPGPGSGKLIRVKVNGKQVGAFAEQTNAVNMVRKHAKAGAEINVKTK